MDPATTRAIMIMRRGLSSDDRASLGKLGDRLQPSGQFAVPEGSQGAALAWREFFIEVINPWCDARRAVAAALLAPEINTGREELLALEWEPNIKPPVLNTLLARLAQVSSGAIGNALRAVRWEKKLFKGILVGERDSLPAIPAKTEVERELDVHKLLLPGEGTAEDRIKKLHVVVVSSEPGAAGKFLHPPSPTCPSPQDLAQVIAPGGYVVWVRELSAQVVEISHSLAAFRSKFSEFMRLGLRLGPHQDERRAEFRNGLRDLIGKYTPIIEPAWFYELRHSNMALKSRKKAGAVEFVFKPAGESILLFYPAAQTGNRPTWRSVTIWRKVQSGDDVAVMNEVFADFPRISKGLESSQEWAFAIMLRRLADSHSGVYSPNQEPEFREVFDEAVRLANQKLLVD